jgi:hypothetical protein
MQANRKSSLTAGLAIVIMAVAAAFTFGYAHHAIVVSGDAASTVNNLKSMSSLFKFEIMGWMLILLCDLIASFALYGYFKDSCRNVARWMAAFRLIYSGILAYAIYHLISISIGVEGINVLDKTVQTEVMNSLHVFETAWSMGLIIFGFHLLLLGFLVYRSVNIHRFWGLLLIIAAASYILIHAGKNFVPGSEQLMAVVEMVLSLPMMAGEVGFALWLIVRGKQPENVLK